MSQVWEEISVEQWEAMSPLKPSTTASVAPTKSGSLKRNQIPDLRMFKRRFRQEGWLSNRRFKTRTGAVRFIGKLEKQINRPKVTYSVYELPANNWDSKSFGVLAMPCN